MTPEDISVAEVFASCWSADECVMDPQCMMYDNCLVTQEEMADDD